MEIPANHTSPRIRKLYFRALAKLSEQLNEAWNVVLPSSAVQPSGTCEIFYGAFCQFGVALYDAYAEDLIASTPIQYQYQQLLDFDLKTFICNWVAPWKEDPVRTYQQAMDADRRGELPGEWTLRLDETWRLVGHPDQGRQHKRVQEFFIDALYLEPGRWDQFLTQLHKAISRRVTHWLAEHAEFTEASPPTVPQPESKPEEAEATNSVDAAGTLQKPLLSTKGNASGKRRGPPRDHETAARVAMIVARVAPEGNWRSMLDDILMALDDERVKTPKTWGPKHGFRSWYASIAADTASRGRHMAIEAIKHHLKRAAETPTETFP